MSYEGAPASIIADRILRDYREAVLRPASMDLSELFRTPPSPSSPTDQLAADARKLASEGKDCSRITNAIDQAREEQARSVERSLDSVVELSKLSDAGKRRTSKEFMLVYQASDGEAKILRGIEFPDNREDKTKEDYETRVIMNTQKGGDPAGKFHGSMAKLKKSLADKNVIYCIAYID